MGKTTLAKLVYNDTKVQNDFSDPALRLWACVSDQDGEKFDVKAILCKIIALVSSDDKKKIDGTSTMEEVQKLFEKNLGGKKYLLVLDDVWNEDRNKWLILENLLKIGRRESRILITTRSERTATIIGNKLFYKLEGLSPEHSWNLFKILAFQDQGMEHTDHLEFVDIGKRIIAKCHNVPLAIEVVGSLLYGNDITKWRSFENSGLSEIGNGDNKIMSILKLSYHNLESSLKSCFSYCALFPKDTRIYKETLISLWLAQGYIVPFDGGQSLEDAAEEHFLTLLRRCFFQNVDTSYFGDVTVEIHDLMHDVAQEVGMREICVSSCTTSNVGGKIRHVQCAGERCPESSFFKSKIRSYICGLHGKSVIESHRIDSWMCLRVLDLEHSDLKELPDWIGKLLHLRYLNLSFNIYLKTLPDSITELHNLQTLSLRFCLDLRKLPKNISKLVKLRHLDLSGCRLLTTMLAGMAKLTNLRVLPYVLVGEGSSSEEGDGALGLGNLKYLTAIKGEFTIDIYGNREGISMNNDTEGWYLRSMKYLTDVNIQFDRWRCGDQEGVMEKLEPHSNVKGFNLLDYKGRVIPRWGLAQSNWANCLPLLVNIEFLKCPQLEQMPLLSKLPCLKRLTLYRLEKLEYVEETSNIIGRSDDDDYPTMFFPSLESLWLRNLKRLKGWWGGEGLFEEEVGQILTTSFRFPRLSRLKIHDTSFPLCPVLQHLKLTGNKVTLPPIVSIQQGKNEDGSVGISHGGENTGLQTLCIDNVDYLRSIFAVADKSSVSEDGDNPWKALSQSLRSLKFIDVNDAGLRIATTGMQYLTSLHTLTFYTCENLEALPEWIGNLSSLHHLNIIDCSALRSLPESMKKLSSLQTLYIAFSGSNLEPHLEDLTRNLHIPDIRYNGRRYKVKGIV